MAAVPPVSLQPTDSSRVRTLSWLQGRVRMKNALFAPFLFLAPCLACAEWKVEYGITVGSLHDNRIGIIATLPAKSTFKGISAYLQIECLDHPDVTTRIVSIVTSIGTVPKLMMWSYQLDDRPPVQRGPYSRLSLKVIGLGDSSSDEFNGLLSARQLRVNLIPAKGPQWSFDFDLAGASQAIRSIPCKR